MVTALRARTGFRQNIRVVNELTAEPIHPPSWLRGGRRLAEASSPDFTYHRRPQLQSLHPGGRRQQRQPSSSNHPKRWSSSPKALCGRDQKERLLRGELRTPRWSCCPCAVSAPMWAIGVAARAVRWAFRHRGKPPCRGRIAISSVTTSMAGRPGHLQHRGELYASASTCPRSTKPSGASTTPSAGALVEKR